MKVAQGCLWVAAMLAGAVSVSAQSLEPRLYSNAPTGLNFLLGGYVHSSGGAIADPSLELEDGDIEFNSPFVAYARSFGVFGKSVKFDMVIPYGFASGSATFDGAARERAVDGFADPQFRVSLNVLGAPALTLKEFRDYQQDWVVGTSVKVTAPLGQYDFDKLLNVGMNRWSIKPEIGISKSIGSFVLEGSGAGTFYTANDDFMGGQTREQDPIYSVQAHLVYILKNKIWLALDGTFYAGGRATVDGEEQGGEQQNSRLGATLALPVNKNHSVKLYASSGVSTRTGTNFDTMGAAWQYRWGGGL